MNDRTKKQIATAFKRLMVSKSIEQIRIGDICKSAQIERTTFYYHFRDKFDCIAWILDGLLFQSDLKNPASVSKGFKTMQKNASFIAKVYQMRNADTILSYMFVYYTRRYASIVKESLGVETLSEDISLAIRMYCHGCIHEGRDWLLGGCKTDAAKQAEMMMAAMPYSLKKALQPNM